jgi:hypothetical protein
MQRLASIFEREQTAEKTEQIKFENTRAKLAIKFETTFRAQTLRQTAANDRASAGACHKLEYIARRFVQLFFEFDQRAQRKNSAYASAIDAE